MLDSTAGRWGIKWWKFHMFIHKLRNGMEWNAWLLDFIADAQNSAD